MVLPSLETIFPVRKGERKLALLLFFHSLTAVGAFVAGRAVRDALFLAHGGRQQLAWMYVASAVAVALCGLGYAPLAARIRRDKIALQTASVFGTLFAVAFAIDRFAAPPPLFYAGLYVFVEVMGAITVVQFWTLANELFHAGEAKRLYGMIASGGTLSNVIVGVISARLATAFGAGSMLLLCALLLGGTAVTSYLSGRFGRQRIFARKALKRSARSSLFAGANSVLRSEHLRTVAALAAITFFTTTVVDFQFKLHAGATLDKDALAAYFSNFYALVGVLAVGLQLFGTGRVMAKAGVIGALLILPLSLAAGSLALGLFPVLLAAALTKGADTLFRYSVNDATTQLLYLPVAPPERASSKAFIDSGVKQLAIALAGLALLGYSRLFHGPAPLAYAGAALCAIWAVLVLRLRTHYVKQLQDTLRRRKVDFEAARSQLQTGETQNVLVRALESWDAEEVLNALELLPVLENVELDQRVEPLLDHELETVRIAALGYYGRRQTLRFANSVFRRFDDPSARVRAAAVNAFCAMGRDKSVRSVRHLIADPDPGVRGAAITGMIRFGGLDGVLAAAGALKEMIGHVAPAMREHAAKVLGAIGVRNFYQPVLELMNDPDPVVRRQAILSAGALGSQEFVLPLLYKTGSAQTGREAIEALSAFGASIAPTLGKVLGNRLESPGVRRGAVRVLGRLASEAGAEIITRHLDEPDEELRTQLFRALARAVRANKLLNVDTRQVKLALVAEVMRAYRALAAAESLGLEAQGSPADPASLLASALEEKVAKSELRIFLLLSVLYPEAGMEHIYAGFGDRTDPEAPRRRANAVELLDNLLDRGLKAKLLPLLDDLPRAQKLATVFPELEARRFTANEASADLCHDETAWVRACAIFHAAKQRLPHAFAALEAASTDPSPLVREAAIVFAVELEPARGRALAQARTEDEALVVRRQATWLVTSA